VRIPHSTPGTHDADVMLTVFLSGRGLYRNGSTRVVVERGMVGLVPPDDPGILMADLADPYTHTYCRFNGAYALRLAHHILVAQGQRFFHHEAYRTIAERVHRMGPVGSNRPIGEMGHREILLAEILVDLLGHEAIDLPTALTLESLMQYIQEHIAEPIRLDALAEYFNMSVHTLCRRVKALTSRTVVDLCEDEKIRWGKTLLECGELNVTQVAIRVGYADPLYFSRVFKKRTGVSPRHWMRSQQR
jgi:AraC-like DNA-binding protein